MAESTDELIARADVAYDQGNPIMTDEEYDNLTAGQEQSLRGTDILADRKIEHRNPMLSLDKVRTNDSVQSWLKSVAKVAADPASVQVSVEYKYDGFALVATYYQGSLLHVATRGNGSVGENVTQNARRLFPANLPQFPAGFVEIRGEALMPKASLSILANYGYDYSNTRNGVPGLIRRNDNVSQIVWETIDFAVYDVIGVEYGLFSETIPGGFQNSKITYSRQAGGENHRPTLTLDLSDLGTSTATVMDDIRDIESARDGLEFDIDGAVVKVIDQDIRTDMGATSHHPRWAVAFKYAEVVKPTTLRHVGWSRGRTGRVVPVAYFDSVDLGSNVSQATMHNLDIFNGFAPHEGDTVLMKRSGEVIPYIMAVEHNGDGPAMVPPTVCPDCETDLVVQGADLFCSNPDCGLEARTVNALTVMDVKGIAYGLINKLMAPGEYLDGSSDMVDVLDRLLTLESEELEVIRHFEGEGPTSEANAIAALGQLRNPSMAGWLASLGIKGIAHSTAQKMLSHFSTLGDIDAGAIRSGAVPSLGDFAATQVEAHMELIERLDSMLDKHGIDKWVYDPLAGADEGSEFYGKNVVVTGVFDGPKRPQIEAWLTEQGANIQGSVSKTTNILFAGERAGSKLAKANAINEAGGSVEIRSELPF